jgi:hypothetical protein
VLLRSKGEGVHVDTLIRVSCVGLVRLDPREVRTFTLREAVLAVKLELSGDDRVLSPTMHVQRSLSKDECSGIRDTRVIEMRSTAGSSKSLDISRGSRVERNLNSTKSRLIVRVGRTVPVSSETSKVLGRIIVKSTSILEKTLGIDESIAISSNGGRTSEGVDSIRKSINSICVVERLGSKDLEEKSITGQRRTVVNVLIRLDNPDELLNRVVEVKLDLVRRRTDGLVTSELELSDEVLVRVLCHSAALVSVKEHIVDIERSSNQRLVVGNGSRDRASDSVLTSSTGVRVGVAVKGSNSPETLINRTNIKVDLDLVVLKSNQWKSKTGVGVEPELKRNIKGSLRKSITRSTHLTRSQGVTRRLNIRERRISNECKLGCVTNHLEVTTLLLRCHCKLVPDVHPVTILTVNSLTTDFNLNLGNKLLSRVIKPTSINTSVLTAGVVSETHKLVDLRKCNLEISAISKITISGDHALNTATKIGLTVESLFNRLNSEVCVTTISNFPKSNLRVTSKVNILGAIGNKLH